MRESINAKGEHMVEDTSIGNDGSTDMRGALVVGPADQPKENGSAPSANTSNNIATTTTSRTTRPDRPPSISLSTRNNGHNTTNTNTTSTKSKTATPVTATFSSAESKQQDQQRPSRPPRGGIELPAKRSHKKGAGIQAQLAAAAAAAAAKGGSKSGTGGEDAGPELDGDNKMDRVEMGGGEEERGDGEGDGSGDGGGGEEPRYCYCGDVSYGEMVGCDADDCAREWFHLSCVGLSRAPAKTGALCLSFFLLSCFFGARFQVEGWG